MVRDFFSSSVARSFTPDVGTLAAICILHFCEEPVGCYNHAWSERHERTLITADCCSHAGKLYAVLFARVLIFRIAVKDVIFLFGLIFSV